MCGRYYLKISIDKLLEKYGIIDDDFNYVNEYQNKKKSSNNNYREFDREIYPSQKAPIILQNIENSKLILEDCKWGFAPTYSKNLIINARAETINRKKTFKNPFLKQRCLVPASAFFEWEKQGSKKVKQRIYLQDRNLFSLAAIYDTFPDDKGEKIQSFTIITTKANNKISKIHNRMPVILQKKDEKSWLDTNFDDPEELKELLKPYSEQEMKIVPEDKNGKQMSLGF